MKKLRSLLNFFFWIGIAASCASQTIPPSSIRPATTDNQVLTTLTGGQPPTWAPNSFSAPFDVGNYRNTEGSIESNGVFYAQNGCVVWGDSNSAGVGMPFPLFWSAKIAAALNISSCSGSNGVSTTVPGDNSADFADRVNAGAFPASIPNPVNFVQYTTNILKTETNVTPPAPHKISYTSQMADGIMTLATSSDDNYRPIQQPVTMNGSQSIAVTNNVATATLATNFQIGQKLLISGCTNAILNKLNYVQIASITPSSFTFSYSNAFLGITFPNETCTFAPSNPWVLSGTWTPLQSFAAIGFTSGASQGTSYLPGNVLTLTCTVQNAKFLVAGVSADSDLGITIDITASGGVITAATLNNPGTIGIINGTYLIVNAGGQNAVIQVNTATGTLIPTSVTLVPGQGGTGYTTGTGTATISRGRLSTGALKQIQVGAGCPFSSTYVLTMACANGTASSCGQLATFNNFTGPNVMTTNSSASMSLGGIVSGNTTQVGFAYMVGSDYGGSFQLLIDGVACRDSFTGNTTIVESYQGSDGFAYAPANWSSGDTVQLMLCAVTPNVTHAYTVNSINSANITGIVGLMVPPANTYTGVNVPNAFVGGAVPLQNNSQPSCGITDPQGCQIIYSQWLEQLVQQLASLGLNTKYTSLLSVNGFHDMCNTFPINSLQNNVVCNSTNGLHGAESFHAKIASKMLALAKVIPATSKDLGGSGGIFRTSQSLLQGLGSGLFETNLTQPNSAYSGRLMAVMQTQQPFSPCYYTINPNLDIFKQPGLLTCPWEFVDNGAGFDSLNLNATSLAASNISQGSPTEKFVSSVFNSGIYIASVTQGTGYSGTGTLVSTGGTCSVQPTFTITQTGGALNPQPLTRGICTVAPTGFTLGGFTGGSGFNITFGLGTEVAISTQVPGLGYSGSGTATPIGGTCTIAPTLSATQAGGGITVALTNAPVCTVIPTGVSLSGFTGGSGFAATFIQPNGAIQTTWNIQAGTNSTAANLSATLVDMITTRGPSPNAPVRIFRGPNSGGYGLFLEDTTATQFANFHIRKLTAAMDFDLPNHSGTLMDSLTTIGTSGAATFDTTTGILNIPVYAGGGSGGTVTSFAAPSGSWPAWLVPTVTNSTTTPSLAVASSTIPVSAGGTGLATQTANAIYKGNGTGAEVPSGLTDNGTTLTYAGAGAYNAIQITATVFSSLATCNSGLEGSRASVTDSTTATFLATITGGGSNHVPAYCDGTSWKVY